MTEINETEVQVSGESKFTQVALIVISVLLIFVGPTYIPFLMLGAAGAVAADVVGFVLFLAGIGLLAFVLRKKLIT